MNFENVWVTPAFATPLLAIRFTEASEVNQALEALALDLEASSVSMIQSNVGGWQSPKTLQFLTVPQVSELLKMISTGAAELISRVLGRISVDAYDQKISLWANVNRSGHFNGPHHHGGAGFFSGVYYPGRLGIAEYLSDMEGAIVFRDPSWNSICSEQTTAPDSLKAIFARQISFIPQPGLLLIFPSWLEHWVLPHQHESARVSFAFDMTFRSLAGNGK